MNTRENSALSNLVRVGTVSSVDIDTHAARVTFADKQDTDGKPLVSGPLKVLQNQPHITIGNDNNENTERNQTVTAHPWLPHVGQLVVCLYLVNGESDGFVLGGI